MKTVVQPSGPNANFQTLNLQDLLEAREAYHVHLSKLPNVVGTAVGRFRFRQGEAGANDPAQVRGVARPYVKRSPRRLENSVVTPWSWPALMVFVRQWEDPAVFARQPDNAVPRRLYLPDGRVIPTCVLEAPPVELAPPGMGPFDFPDDFVGGGYPIFSQRQGTTRFGSVACLVTDGQAIYALTNRHVAGEAGTEIYSMLRGETVRVGVTHRNQLDKAAFNVIYRGFPGDHTIVNLDAALVSVDNIHQWSAQIFGLGEVGATVDLSTENLSLDLISTPVRAFGCGSGPLRGEVQALFYRYKARGGLEYVADLLIGTRQGDKPLTTQPGDSGTLWVIDGTPPFRPIGVQWGGGRTMADDGHVSNFGMATFLSTICRELSAEVITDWNAAQPEYWGQIGHYKIGAIACTLASNARLAKLLNANMDRIGLLDPKLTRATIDSIDPKRFVPLADVPDDVWKAKGHSRPKDKPNHFADLDEPGHGTFAGKTLLELCKKPQNLSLEVWRDFYDSIGTNETHRGILPFRVWQIFNLMVTYVHDQDVTKFIGAAGILAHYVGDACQPLHASRLHDGETASDAGVHTAYETAMLNANIGELISKLDAAIQNKKASPKAVTGKDAAWEAMELMRRTFKALPPMDVIKAYRAAPSQTRSKFLWEKLGDRTADRMADGALTLAILWESAWKQGDGHKIPDTKLKAVRTGDLKALYDTQAYDGETEFLPSFYLKDYIAKNVLGA